MKATKKPVEIEFHVLHEDFAKEILAWSTPERPIEIFSDENGIDHAEITTLEGVQRAEYGDIIIKGVKGEVYPCKPDIFEMTYDVPMKGVTLVSSCKFCGKIDELRFGACFACAEAQSILATGCGMNDEETGSEYNVPVDVVNVRFKRLIELGWRKK